MALAGSVISTLSPLEAHVLLALSSTSHLLISLADESSLSSLCGCIEAVCRAGAIHRSSHVVELTHEASDGVDAERLLSSFFTLVDGIAREVPQVVVLPYIDAIPRSTQAALKDALRDRWFELHGHRFLMPDKFVCIGIMLGDDFEGNGNGISRHLADHFGLSLALPYIDAPATEKPHIPPTIPLKPPLYYAPQLKTYTSDLLSGLRHHPSLHAYLLTNRCSAGYVLTIADLWTKLKRAEGNPDDQQGQVVYPRTGDIRPEQIREVLLSCVAHRLRLREEQERLSNFWGAPQNRADHGKQVDDIVQDVLKSV